MDYSDFRDLVREARKNQQVYVPVYRQKLADLYTPLSIYLKLANNEFSFLLESVLGGERSGRYSFVGLTSPQRIVVKGNVVELIENGKVIEKQEGAPLDWIEKFRQERQALVPAGLPKFCGGLVGYFGFDSVRLIEEKLENSRYKKPDLSGLPDIVLLVCNEIAMIDNITGTLTLVQYVKLDEAEDEMIWQASQARLDELIERLDAPLDLSLLEKNWRSQYDDHDKESMQSVKQTFDEAGYKDAIEKAKEYILDGDLMQVVLSQRMSAPFIEHPLKLYRALRALNPSPYMFYFNFRDFFLVGASPEILVRLEDDHITLRPIAGTRPRGRNLEEDDLLAKDLLADPKERAEHLQLLDLGRNDVGRIAEIGTVDVTDRYVVERYSHVMHIVSNVHGKIRSGLTAMDVLKATFPAGTISGAPKIRAIEIIDELEPESRNIYSGAIGYMAYNGDMDLCIAIRTALVRGGRISVQAGAGITLDSDPDSEWMESQNKAQALMRAAEQCKEAL